MTSGDRFSREALIEAAAQRLVTDETLLRHTRPLVESVATVLLPLIADAIEAEANRRRAEMSRLIGREMTHDTAVGCGVRVAARLVRSLTTPTEAS